MDLEDAQRVAGVIMAADAGCSVCVADLTYRLTRAFPAFVWTLDEDAAAVRDPLPRPYEVEGDIVREYAPVLVRAA